MELKVITDIIMKLIGVIEELRLKMEIMRVYEQFKDGDPGAPLGCFIDVIKDNKIVCTVELPNEDNEDIQNAIEKALSDIGFVKEHSSNIDPDYGYY